MIATISCWSLGAASERRAAAGEGNDVIVVWLRRETRRRGGAVSATFHALVERSLMIIANIQSVLKIIAQPSSASRGGGKALWAAIVLALNALAVCFLYSRFAHLWYAQ